MKLMGGKTKKFFLSFNRLNKPAVLAAVFFLIFLGLATPSQFSQAQGLFGAIASLPMNLFTTVILQPILFVSNIICALARMILGWVVGPYFTTLPYTHGGIVEIGWPIVRDFINMFFVIALVVIGLATALRIKEYQAQKALPTLIIIALLINFTPVICGLIVDASNIIMNLFLERLTGFAAIGESFEMQGSIISELWRTPGHFFDIRYTASALGQSLVMIIFDWVAAYVFFIFALLFIMRYVMIWALVIVSPIAFFSKIFPGAQKHLFKSILGWDEWWKEFIEWSLLGVVAGFFLYLAEQLMTIAPGMISGLPPGQGTSSWVDNPLVDFVNNFLPWMVVLVFLWLGYKIAKATSAMGAQGAIKAVDTGLKIAKAAGITAATLGVGAIGGASGVLGRAAAGARRLESFVGKTAFSGTPVGKSVSWVTRQLETVSTPLQEKWREAEEEVARKAGEEAKKRNVQDNLAAFRRASRSEQTEIISTMIDLKQTKDAVTPEVVGAANVLSDDEVSRAYENARRRRQVDTAEKFEQSFATANTPQAAALNRRFAAILDQTTATLAPDDRTGFAGRPNGLDASDVRKGYTSFGEKIIGEAKSAEAIKRLQKGWWDNPALLEAAHKFWGGHQIAEAARIFGRGFNERFQEAAQAHGIDWYFDIDPTTGRPRNPDVPRFLASSAAQGLGMSPLPGGERASDINFLMKVARTQMPRPGIAQEEIMVEQINLMTKRIKNLKRRSELTIAEETEIKMLGTTISSLRNQLGKPIPPPPSPPKTPPKPPEVPQVWVLGPNKTWVPPKGYTPRIPVKPEDEHDITQELRKMTAELDRLRKQPIRSNAEEEEITMLENTIREFRERLGK